MDFPVINRSILAAAVVACTLCTPVQADDEDAREYREHIMKSLNAQAAVLGQIVSYAVPPDNLQAHLDTIALLASTALEAFEPKVPGGEAKPEVWSQWPDFSKRMREFADKTAAAAKLGHTASPEEALTNMLDVMDCKSCHEVYRNEKKGKKP
jgi:cytochrome c556